MINEKNVIRAMWDKFDSFYNVALRFDEAETKMANRVLTDVQRIIDEQPKVGEWIPVSERGPKEFERVMVWIECKIGNDVTYMHGFSYQVEDIWYGDAFGAKRKVLAWMPLPDRYKEAE